MEPVKRPSRRNRPLKVALTGGIGSGKSTVARVFRVLKVPIFDADREAKLILANDPDVIVEVKSAFGEKAYVDGSPNKQFLADIVFSDQKMRSKLNGIIHPAVARSFESFCRTHSDCEYVIKEAAITIETGAYQSMDSVILVTAPEQLRVERVVRRDQTNPEKVRGRMKAQWTDERKRPYAQFEVVNDDQTPVIPAVLQIHNALLRSANP